MIITLLLSLALACHCGPSSSDSEPMPPDSPPPGDTDESSTVVETGDTAPPRPSDLNGDGFPDLILAGYKDTLQSEDYAQTTRIHLGGADGFETTPSQTLEGFGTREVLVEDLDGDGHLDIVLVNNRRLEEDFDVSSFVYWGRQGSFEQSARTELPSSGATDAVAADLNQDGFTDLVFACFKGGVSPVYWGSAEGFDPEERLEIEITRARAVLAEDLDGDGWIDLAFASERDGEGSYQAHSSVLLNGPEGFDPDAAIRLPTVGAWSVQAGDLDRDGHRDLLFLCREDDGDYRVDSYLYYGAPEGWSETRRATLPTRAATDAAIADLNGDGWEEIVFAQWFDNERYDIDSTIYWNSAQGFSEERRSGLPALGPQAVIIEDLDLDGHPDVLLPTFCTDGKFPPEARIFWGSAEGPDADRMTTLEPGGIRGFTVSDANLDGWPDIVFAGYNSPCHVTAEESYTFWGGPEGFGTPQAYETPVIHAEPVVVGGHSGTRSRP
jgi:hypothetical protein